MTRRWTNRLRGSQARCVVSLFLLVLVLAGCGVGSGGNDAGSGTGADGGTGTPADELAIEITGQTKYRADEGVSLSYTLSGSSADSATVTYDGPVELTLDSDA
ncbi:MAG: hypothetical protein VW317_08360, partial [Halieaceae bacterium]